MGADILVVPVEYAAAGQEVTLIGQPNSFFFEDTGFENTSAYRGLQRQVPRLYCNPVRFMLCCPIQMIAIDQGNDFTVSAWLKKNPGEDGKDDMIIGSAIIQDTGNDLMFYGTYLSCGTGF